MLRLFRLLKLDKYVPSISLVDDVLRLKKNVLLVSCFAASSLWVLFAGLMYLAEYKDHSTEIDDLPLYGCYENCTMSDRYENFFKSVPLTGIHLTGDFPLIEYDGYGRIVCFAMVIAAIGVVSIPSGVMASGFAEIVQSKAKASRGEEVGAAGDDWFDIRYRELEGQAPPVSAFGPRADTLQQGVHEYLNGKIDERTGLVTRTTFSRAGRLCFFSLIIANVIAVVVESIPEVDKYVGNDRGNFFDVFEAISVGFFTLGELVVFSTAFILCLATLKVSLLYFLDRVHSSSNLSKQKQDGPVLALDLHDDILWFGRFYLHCSLVPAGDLGENW